MRNIYENKKINWPIQQGVIFNGCIADEYIESDVYGIIITPRCDIENRKIKTIHYLPIIKLQDWINLDFIRIFQKEYRNNLKGKILSLFKQYKISPSLFEMGISKEDILKVAEEQMPQKEFSKFITEIDKFYLSGDINEVKKMCNESEGIRNKIIKDVKEGKNSSFYLIEDWKDKSNYRIILLREIKRITFEMANKISKGVSEDEITEDDLRWNDINKVAMKDNLIYVETQMKSPFIEHLIQSFFHNFGRIGVDNMDNQAENNLISEIKKAYKK